MKTCTVSDQNVTINVTIPVTMQWVGQRDQDEGTTEPFDVTRSGANVVLTRKHPCQNGGINRIELPWSGLEAANTVLETYLFG